MGATVLVGVICHDEWHGRTSLDGLFFLALDQADFDVLGVRGNVSPKGPGRVGPGVNRVAHIAKSLVLGLALAHAPRKAGNVAHPPAVLAITMYQHLSHALILPRGKRKANNEPISAHVIGRFHLIRAVV